MATAKTNSTTQARTTKPRATAPATAQRPVEEPVERIVPKEIDVNQYVTVRNGFHGLLVYVSKHTGEVFEWSAFGDEQEMTLAELKSAKSSAKGFFSNNWFMFDEPWIIDYLGVRKFYENALSLDEFERLFSKKPEEITKIVSKMSDGQKRSIKYLAAEKIRNGEIDSRKLIASLEKLLGTRLIED